MHFHSPIFNTLISIGMGWTIAAISTTGKWVRAQTSPSISHEGIVTFQVFEPPPGQGEPENSAGGGSRNDQTCLEESQIQVLSPPIDGESAANIPILSVYLPPTSAKAAIVNVEDADRNSLYYAQVPMSGEPGILSVSLPQDILPVATEARYYWTLSVMCSDELDPNDPTLEGWVESVDGDSLVRTVDEETPSTR